MNTLAHGRQDDINNRLFAATNRHLHGDAVSQRQASANQRVMTSPEHTWEEGQSNHTSQNLNSPGMSINIFKYSLAYVFKRTMFYII